MKRSLLVLTLILLLQTVCCAEKFSFAVFGDKQGREAVFNDIAKTMNMDRSIKFAINTGDLTEKGTQVEYNKYWADKSKIRTRIYDVIGNHDRGRFNAGYKIFKNKYGGTYSYFDHENCRFILIDNSSSKGLGQAQWKWIKEALSTNEKIFVFMHKPLFDPSGGYPSHVMSPQSEVSKLKDLFMKSGVKYIVSGHIHGYGKAEDGGTVYIVTAGAGAPLYLPHFNGGFYHYVKITVDNDKISDEVVRIYNE